MDQVHDSFKLFLAKSEQVGDVVKDVSKMAEKAFMSHLDIVKLAERVKKPTDEQLRKIFKNTSDIIISIENLKQQCKSSLFFDHVAGIAESVPAFGWVAISPTPAPYVKEMMDAAQFYTNKVLRAFKEKDKLHVEWVQSWLQFLQDLQKYIRQSHTTGLTWNPRGEDYDNTSSSLPPPPPPPVGNMPPPPPPDMMMGQVDPAASARSALLKDLNKGTDITKGLRKVNLDDRNRQLTTPMSDRSSRSKTPEPRTVSATSHPPKFEFEGKKWLVEYQDGSNQDNFVIEVAEMNQVVSMYKCENITVTVKGKTNSITVDSCKKVNIAFDDIVSFVEFINCQKIQAYPTGKVATITIDKTDSIQLFLRRDSINAEIISAKSAEINACIVDEATGDYKEYPLPEQLKTVWCGNQFKTEALAKA